MDVNIEVFYISGSITIITDHVIIQESLQKDPSTKIGVTSNSPINPCT
jgi:hypothetical protein